MMLMVLFGKATKPRKCKPSTQVMEEEEMLMQALAEDEEDARLDDGAIEVDSEDEYGNARVFSNLRERVGVVNYVSVMGIFRKRRETEESSAQRAPRRAEAPGRVGVWGRQPQPSRPAPQISDAHHWAAKPRKLQEVSLPWLVPRSREFEPAHEDTSPLMKIPITLTKINHSTRSRRYRMPEIKVLNWPTVPRAAKGVMA
ncbi:hypothetical protein GGX14DRAFT_618932, partial [Mycena pura]